MSISGAKERAKSFILDMMANGTDMARDIEAAAREQRFGQCTLHNAKRELGIVSKKDGIGGPWRWVLPPSHPE